MRDNEIINALELCIDDENRCGECPYFCVHKDGMSCAKAHGIDLLDLINRQKAEIERLKGNAVKQPILIYPYAATAIELVPSKEQIKAEAIKDFAERLTHTLVINNEENTEIFDFSYTLETIDNLVKEMIGESNV